MIFDFLVAHSFEIILLGFVFFSGYLLAKMEDRADIATLTKMCRHLDEERRKHWRMP